MISPEVLRRYPFFAGLSHDQLVALAMTAEVMEVEAGYRFFREGDMLDALYLVTEGNVGVVIEVTADDVKQSVAQQLTGDVATSDIVISYVGPGEPFGWSALAVEGDTTAGAVASVATTVVVFDKIMLLEKLDEDPVLGRLMLQHILRSVRQRLQDLRVECLTGSAA